MNLTCRIRKGYIFNNPVNGIDFFPVIKKTKFIPSAEEIDKVISFADKETQDYLWVIRETLARVNEINKLKWSDVNLNEKYVVLYTRKKKGGHLTPRKIPMTKRLYDILKRRYEDRRKDFLGFFGMYIGVARLKKKRLEDLKTENK